MCNVFAKRAHSALANCGPLSEMTFSGMPCLAKMSFIFMMTYVARIEYTLTKKSQWYTIEYQSVSIIFQQDSVVLSTVI